MKKRIIAALLTALIILPFSGCGNNEAPPTVSSPDPTSVAVTTEPPTEIVDESSSKNTPDEVSKSSPSGELKAYFLDVGQGDCEFIELPSGETMLIDAGNQGNGSEIVSFIKGKGYQNIDYVVATHPHADHIGGMPQVLNSLTVGAMYMPRKTHDSNIFETLVDTIEARNVPLYTAKAGTSILANEQISVDILAPVSESYSNLNNYSAVVRITFGQTAFLFMGDAEQVVERELLGNSDKLKANVLKVGHHGSDSSSSTSFIKAVSPKAAVISCGKNNQYGHPDSSTLATLNSYGADIYRTDEVGTIIITADSNGKISVDKSASTIKENAPPVVQESSQSNTSTGSNEVVYKTKTGECYHNAGCSSLSKSKIETTVSAAQASGLRPCKKCHPPQ